MFVAWRDLRFARGRFLLISSVVALITVLVGFLAGLTGGLAAQNVSAVLALPGDRVVLQQPTGGTASWSESALGDRTVEQWREAAGVTGVTRVGITQGRAEGGSGPVPVALLGIGRAPSGVDPSAIERLAPTSDDAVGLSEGAAESLGLRPGDRLTVAGASFEVATVGGDLWYSHTPVVALSLPAWSRLDRAVGRSGESTALAVTGTPDWDAVASRTGTVAQSRLASLGALETFRSEVGSLALMIAMLFGVSALVVGAFFTVWTMQRAGDVSVLKALGATTASLVRDALGQALVVLVAGIGVGLLVVVGLGVLAGSALPFLLSPLTTIAPALAMAVLGLAGAAVALRTVVSADPLTALGSNR